ncbi:MAG: hypothetical protein K2M34_00630 [Alphaproteobacteria bacterium]|nr:hypothetical protein [Alphaproteobacteria bacterium]
MKNELKISTISMICVLCASGMSGAYGASSVRTLGGAGTYTSAASASQSGGSAGVARAGSVRVAPSTVKATTAKPSNSASVTAGRAATSPRLSLGKYLGGGTAISGGSSTRPGTGTSGGGTSTTNPGLSADVSNRLEVLEDKVADLKSANDDLKESKQDKLTGDDYIEIDKDGNVSLIVENLKEDLQGINGRDVVIGVSDDNKYIVWKNDGDEAWTKLIAIDDLVGPQGEKGDKGDPGDAADMALYSTTEQMNAAIADALKGYVAVGDIYSKTEIDEKLKPVSTFEERMADLTKAVEDNMQALQEDMEIVNNINNTVSKIVNENGDIVINASQIAENSITAREIAPNSITNTELANNTVKLENLNTEVTDQLVGAPEDEEDGMYVLLVTPTGERIWADLATEEDVSDMN